MRLKALETPGHTPESISLRGVRSRAQRHAIPTPCSPATRSSSATSDAPICARRSAGRRASLGNLLYDSLQHKLLALPDDSLVYPAHGAGSLCGKALGKETFTTIGEQRRANYALQPMSREAFVELVTADQPDAPAYFVYDAVLNAKEHQTLDRSLAEGLKPLTLEQVLDRQRDGAQILDTREPSEFAAAHLKGSQNIGLGGQYATWAGSILDPQRPIVIIAEAGREQESAMRLGRIGFDRVVGYLADVHSLESRPELRVSTERLSPGVAAERLHSDVPPTIVDVRTAARARDQVHRRQREHAAQPALAARR